MNRSLPITAFLITLIVATLALSAQSYYSSRLLENYQAQANKISHDLLNHRDDILNYDSHDSRQHFKLTQKIVELEKRSLKLKNEASKAHWFELGHNHENTLSTLTNYHQQLKQITSKLDLLVGIQVAKKYAEISLNSLFNKALQNIPNDQNINWQFVSFMQANQLSDHVKHPQISQFSQQLQTIENRRKSLSQTVLDEQHKAFIEQTGNQLRQLSQNSLSLTWLFASTAMMLCLGLFMYLGYRRYRLLNQLNQELEQASEKALNAAKAKSQFLATMSHELRTPMNGVLGLAQIIATDTKEATTKQNTHIILESGQHLLTVINDILDFSKIEENKLTLENGIFYLNQVIAPVMSAIQPLAEEKHIKFELNQQIEPNRFFKGDRARLRQILFNLAGNAVKFTHQGGVTITATLTPEPNSQLQLAISDTGIGIPEDKHGAIFKSFEQADTSTTREFGGSGLGLAIVERLTHLMSGEITLSSEINLGSTFTVRLPLETGLSQQVIQDEQTHFAPSQDRPLKILLAEDNRVNAIVAKGFCAKLGHSVEIAENGLIATQLAKTNQYDLILMDNHMPEMNGVEATRFIRQQLNINTLIFAYTADVFREAHDDFIQAGADHVLTKPLQHESFCDALISFAHRIQAQKSAEPTQVEQTNVITLQRAPASALPLTEEELTNSEILSEIKQDVETYRSIVDTLIADFELAIDQLIEAYSEQDAEQLHKTLHCVKGIALNLQLDNLAQQTQTIEQAVLSGDIPDIESFQKLINRLSVNIHQSNRIIERLNSSENVVAITPNS
ncbi:ATP-binding protein [Vibrio intestinalis]|uniref:ATP-binding protein n=1 Tax=Vibrio intestinalis TaxID=2933291 RepID=UPI0021A8AF86|nr:ATP-binding protein [Vibrio intestinalis]